MSDQDKDMGGVGTFVKYGSEFVDKHEGQLGERAATMGGLVMGFMRAILECDNCGPGVFRVPSDPDWNQLYCPSCGGVWVKKED